MVVAVMIVVVMIVVVMIAVVMIVVVVAAVVVVMIVVVVVCCCFLFRSHCFANELIWGDGSENICVLGHTEKESYSKYLCKFLKTSERILGAFWFCLFLTHPDSVNNMTRFCFTPIPKAPLMDLRGDREL